MIETIDVVDVIDGSHAGGAVEANASDSLQNKLFSEETKPRARQNECQDSKQHSEKNSFKQCY